MLYEFFKITNIQKAFKVGTYFSVLTQSVRHINTCTISIEYSNFSDKIIFIYVVINIFIFGTTSNFICAS